MGLNVTWSVNAVVIMIVIVLAARGTPGMCKGAAEEPLRGCLNSKP